MEHEKIKKLLPLYIDDGLNEEENKIVKDHLKNCQQCRQELKQYRENYNFLSKQENPSTPTGLLSSIKKQVNKQYQSEPEKKNLIDIIKNIFKKELKIPAGVAGIAVIALLFIFIGLPFYNVGHQNDLNIATETFSSKRQMTAQTSTENKTPGQQDKSGGNLENRKIIKTARLVIEVDTIDGVNDKIMNVLEEMSGFIAHSRQWENSEGRKYNEYTLRIKAEYFKITIDKLEKMGETISCSVSGRDITEEYMDLNTRLKNLKIQEERYLELLDRATNVEDILKIEKELNRVRTEIERLQGRINYYDDKVDLSTINIEFREPEKSKISGFSLIEAFKIAASNMLDNLYKLITITGTILPYLLLSLLVIYIFKKSQK